MNFKDYNQRQTTLLPYSFEDLIPEKHPVRVVDQVVESINIQPLKGIQKVELEFGLMALAHNLRKKIAA
ncbi:MAG: hypothetical protein ACK5IC_04445 [Moheibacter sp.]